MAPGVTPSPGVQCWEERLFRRKMQDRGLPTYPPRGNRRKLDRDWLELLHRDGVTRYPPPPLEPQPELVQAVREFNLAEYWQCHETLEGIWLAEPYPRRLFYHGLIKAAVGLLHLARRNQRGAAVKLADAEYTLAPFVPHFMGVETGRLLMDIQERLKYLPGGSDVDWAALESLPPAKIQLVDSHSLHPGG